MTLLTPFLKYVAAFLGGAVVLAAVLAYFRVFPHGADLLSLVVPGLTHVFALRCHRPKSRPGLNPEILGRLGQASALDKIQPNHLPSFLAHSESSNQTKLQ